MEANERERVGGINRIGDAGQINRSLGGSRVLAGREEHENSTGAREQTSIDSQYLQSTTYHSPPLRDGLVLITRASIHPTAKMPLDTLSTYSQTLLRQDGRRWNELRRITASISTQPSSDGSSLLTMGNTMVLCTVTGPREG